MTESCRQVLETGSACFLLVSAFAHQEFALFLAIQRHVRAFIVS